MKKLFIVILIFIYQFYISNTCFSEITTTPTKTQMGLPYSVSSNRILYSTSSNSVVCTADYLVLRNSADKTITVTGVSWTANITTASPPIKNGPDASSLDTASAWRSIWAIYNPATKEVAGLISASTSSAPTSLPSGFTFYERMGWCRNDASSNFLKFYKHGNRATWVTDLTNIASGITSTTATDVDASEWAPPGCHILFMNGYISTNGTSTSLLQANVIEKDTGVRITTCYFQGSASSTSWEIQTETFTWLNDSRVFRTNVGVSGTRIVWRATGYMEAF